MISIKLEGLTIPTNSQPFGTPDRSSHGHYTNYAFVYVQRNSHKVNIQYIHRIVSVCQQNDCFITINSRQFTLQHCGVM